MLLSKVIVSRLNSKCYLGVTSTRLFSSVRKQPAGFEPKLFRPSYQMNICSSHIRLLSVTGPKLSETNKEELIFQIPEIPAETAAAPAPASELVFNLPEKPSPLDPALLGEPSLDSLGLASYWPSGRLQSCLEWVSFKQFWSYKF